MEEFSQLGVCGILALLLTREVLNFLGRKKPGLKLGNPIDFETLYRRTSDIHKWQEGIGPRLDRQEVLLKESLDCLKRIESHLNNKG